MVIIGRMKKINRSLHSPFLQELMKNLTYWDHKHLRDADEGRGCKCSHHLQPGACLVTQPQKVCLSVLCPFHSLLCEGFLSPEGMIFSMDPSNCTLSSQVRKVLSTPHDFKPRCSFKKQNSHTHEIVARGTLWGSHPGPQLPSHGCPCLSQLVSLSC